MSAIVSLSTTLLNGYVGKTIKDICPLGFGEIGDKDNHCAHFVSHVLRISNTLGIGTTCDRTTYDRKQKNKGKSGGACIRVDEVYNNSEVLKTPDENGCLAYITLTTNIDKDGKMGRQPRKHIGIYFQGSVWHYSNSKDKVVSVKLEEFKKHYPGATTTCFTKFPDGAKALTLDEVKKILD